MFQVIQARAQITAGSQSSSSIGEYCLRLAIPFPGLCYIPQASSSSLESSLVFIPDLTSSNSSVTTSVPISSSSSSQEVTISSSSSTSQSPLQIPAPISEQDFQGSAILPNNSISKPEQESQSMATVRSPSNTIASTPQRIASVFDISTEKLISEPQPDNVTSSSSELEGFSQDETLATTIPTPSQNQSEGFASSPTSVFDEESSDDFLSFNSIFGIPGYSMKWVSELWNSSNGSAEISILLSSFVFILFLIFFIFAISRKIKDREKYSFKKNFVPKDLESATNTTWTGKGYDDVMKQRLLVRSERYKLLTQWIRIAGFTCITSWFYLNSYLKFSDEFNSRTAPLFNNDGDLVYL